MDSADLQALLARHRVVPVVAIHDAAGAPALASALADGGLPLVEVTFRTAAAAASIAAIAAGCPGVTVGAGTVLDAATVDAAVDAGASFVVAPGFSPVVVDRCRERGVPVLPGVLTPSEVERALAAGIRLVKLFPAEAAGGTRYLRALAAPYGAVRFVPTGGVSPANLADYLAIPAVVACGGTWLAPADAIREGRWAEVAAATRAAVAIASAAPMPQP